MYVPFQRAGPTPAPAICDKSTAPTSKTHGHSQKPHVSKAPSPQADRRSNSAIHRMRKATKIREHKLANRHTSALHLRRTNSHSQSHTPVQPELYRPITTLTAPVAVTS